VIWPKSLRYINSAHKISEKMNDKASFVNSTKQHFGFLFSDYSFTMRECIGIFGRTIEFQSPKLFVQICEDHGSVIILLRPVAEPEIAQLGLSNILEALSVKEPQKFRGPMAPAQYDHALGYYATSLKLYCDNLLRGDLSGWVGFLEFALNRMKSEYSSWTKGKQLSRRVYQELEDYIKSKSSK
jgi:hypothetical protein